MRSRVVAIAVLLAACGPFTGPTAGMGWRWKNEPTVGASTDELQQPLAHALERWGYGVRVPDCGTADVCVIVGTQNHAGRRGPRCIAEVREGAVWQTVAHEVGHCFGVSYGPANNPHSDDADSVMHGYLHPWQDVTPDDRRALRRVGDLWGSIQRFLPSFARARDEELLAQVLDARSKVRVTNARLTGLLRRRLNARGWDDDVIERLGGTIRTAQLALVFERALGLVAGGAGSFGYCLAEAARVDGVELTPFEDEVLSVALIGMATGACCG